MKTVKLEQLKAEMLNTPESIQAYEDADRELALIQMLYDMRDHAGITKTELAKRLDINPSAINRLEKNPLGASMNTLERYAKACGARLNLSVQY
ncbi:helix-turn-helix domain-containing protein [Serratia fonticola]|uniref:helix-turn-helix domain-containing protein n=1 Tax=Serratia fonticola TaxID=47917 RepID=UPI0015C5E99C|nr:helix-turn-helix transcriptional regulator [Serratia fonticola]NYA15735.1 helix-turn-helix transcriptional regulator [Serratia fonticola]NYA35855.1 helix-turn-helix transcriptional regulator [Serratia fonticola]